MLPEVADDELVELYEWVDSIPLSRPKRSIARDFADGVLLAEVVAHHFPRLVELHNYQPAGGTQQKIYNWTTLAAKVLRPKLGLALPREELEAAALAAPGAAERVLKAVRGRLAAYAQAQAERAAAAAAQRPADDAEAAAREYGPALAPAAAPPAGGAPQPRAADAPPAILAWRPAGAAPPPAPLAAAAPPSPRRRPSAKAAVAVVGDAAALGEVVAALEGKLAKMEALLRLKDAKIAALTDRLAAAVRAGGAAAAAAAGAAGGP